MKVEYKLSLWGNQHKSTSHARETQPDFCCEDMAEAWAESMTGIALDADRLVVSFHGDTDDGGGEFPAWVPGFRFCPWCAEPIEVVQGAVEDNRVKACKAELARRNYWDEGKPIMCSKNAAKDSDYCPQHTRRHQAEIMAAALKEA